MLVYKERLIIEVIAHTATESWNLIIKFIIANHKRTILLNRQLRAIQYSQYGCLYRNYWFMMLFDKI